MRRFVVLGHTQRAEPPLPLEDLAGAAGRWDVLARCLANGLLVSHGVRPDAEVLLVLLAAHPTRVLRVRGVDVRNLNPDERSTAALASRALEGVDVGAHETRTIPGFATRRVELGALLKELARDAALVWLREDAPTPLESWGPPRGDVAFLLSDHRDPTPEEHAVLRQHATDQVTLGPVPLQADQCIAVVQNRLDRGGVQAAVQRGSPPEPPRAA